MDLKSLYSLLILFVPIFSSCSEQQIPLDTVTHSSELLHCDKVFGTSSEQLEEENKILIQIGRIDTTDGGFAIAAAIITVKNKEIVLNLSKYNAIENKVVETYAKDDYTLVLSYTENPPGTFRGTCSITNGDLKSEYAVEGINNPHL